MFQCISSDLRPFHSWLARVPALDRRDNTALHTVHIHNMFSHCQQRFLPANYQFQAFISFSQTLTQKIM